MKLAGFIFLMVFTIFGKAQDTLYFKTGEVKEVKVFYLSLEKDLIGYESEGRKVYQTISSLEKYILQTKLTPAKLDEESLGGESDFEAIPKMKDVRSKYVFSKWSVSTDLMGLARTDKSTIVTIEPEYEIYPNLSVRLPVRIGLNNRPQNQYRGYDPGTSWGEYRANEPAPGINQFNNVTSFNEELLFEVGVLPKFYPYGKSYKWYSPYIGASLKTGLWQGQTSDNFITLDTANTFSGFTYWQDVGSFTNSSDFVTTFIRGEILCGIDIVFSKVLNISMEGSLDFVVRHSPIIASNNHLRYFDGDYALVETTDGVIPRSVNPRFRILLTYRFGGKIK